MKRYVNFILALCLLCSLAPQALATNDQMSETEPSTVSMEETTTPTEAPSRSADQCGENVRWSYSGGSLTITGSGAMDDFSGGVPWAALKSDITAVTISDGITYIGARAFENCDSLESLSLGGSVYEIGTAAFRSCDALTEVSLPGSFRVFGEESFMSCAGLKKIHFAGTMPKFKLNCLWDTYAKLIFPAKNPWPLEHIIQLEDAFQGRIEFLDSDGNDPYIPEGETQATTEATEATEATETTEAVTEPTTIPTEAPTTAPTKTPETDAPTEVTLPETQPQTTAPTAPEKPEKRGITGIGLAIGLCAISGGMLLLLLRGRLRSGGKYSR